MYEYRASLIAVVDGDTIHADVDLGVDIHAHLTLRFAGINAPELPTPAGIDARVFVANAFASMTTPLLSFVLRTAKDRREKYGRYLAWVILDDGSCLNRRLVDTGHAVAYGNLPIDPPPEQHA